MNEAVVLRGRVPQTGGGGEAVIRFAVVGCGRLELWEVVLSDGGAVLKRATFECVVVGRRQCRE